MTASFRREVELDLDPEELWALVAGGEGWTAWLVDEADVDVRPGATGTIVDDGEVRRVEVDAVEDGTRVSWRWWGRGGDASRVELAVAPAERGSRLLITETRLASPAARACAAAPVRWELRAAVLQLSVALRRSSPVWA